MPKEREIIRYSGSIGGTALVSIYTLRCCLGLWNRRSGRSPAKRLK
ncbi:hypothetical protein [Tychonema sp. LEGE 07203]|nr:hypothetical protein [Tychonema sp. LEGE 07203]MBE9094964.1 hypothetical protein [Tychonema sp. LEGE 07203]